MPLSAQTPAGGAGAASVVRGYRKDMQGQLPGQGRVAAFTLVPGAMPRFRRHLAKSSFHEEQSAYSMNGMAEVMTDTLTQWQHIVPDVCTEAACKERPRRRGKSALIRCTLSLAQGDVQHTPAGKTHLCSIS